jgi:hypothetical protein
VYKERLSSVCDANPCPARYIFLKQVILVIISIFRTEHIRQLCPTTMLRAQLGEIVPWTSARLPVGPLGLPGLGPSSPLHYYDDLDPITSPWTAMDRYSSPRWDVEPYSSAGCDCGLCYGIQAIVRLH